MRSATANTASGARASCIYRRTTSQLGDCAHSPAPTTDNLSRLEPVAVTGVRQSVANARVCVIPTDKTRPVHNDAV